MNVISLSKISSCVVLPFLWWYEIMKHMMRWSEVNDIALGYYWHSEDFSKEGLSALDEPGSSSYDNVWMSGTDFVGGLGVPERWSQRAQDFILLIKTACNLKLMNCLSLEFPINIFGPTLTISSWNQGWGWTTVSPVLEINDPKTNNWQVAEPRFVFSVFLFQFQSPLWGYTN